MAYSWLKLYYEILDDPKMTTLPDYLYRRAIELFLLAGRNGDGGVLPPVAHMAWSLRTEEKRLADNLRSLEQIGVVAEAEPGKWIVVNFAKRQAKEEVAERVRAHRERKKKKPVEDAHETDMKRECNEDVTERYTDKKEIKELTTTSTADPPSKRSNVFEFYSANIGALTSFTADALKDMESTYSEEWTLAALAEAVANEARNLKYAEAILKRWRAEGFKALKPKPKPAQPPGRAPGGKKSASQALDELAAWAAEKEKNVYAH